MNYEDDISSGPEYSMLSPPSQDASCSARSCLLETPVNNGSSNYKFPVLISKTLRKSHVSRGFWMGLPAAFCDNYMDSFTRATKVVLEDDDGKLWDTKYLPNGKGLSGGWRRFALDHKLQVGNTVHFQFISTNRCKVTILQEKDSPTGNSEGLDTWQGNNNNKTSSVTGTRNKFKKGEEESTDHKKFNDKSETSTDEPYGNETTGAEYEDSREGLWERKHLGEVQVPRKICALRRAESHHPEDSFGGSGQERHQLEASVEKKRPIPRNYSTGGRQRSYLKDHYDYGTRDMRLPVKSRAKDGSTNAQMKVQIQRSTSRCRKEDEPSKSRCFTSDMMNMRKDQSGDEDEGNDSFCLRPRDRQNPAAAAEDVRSEGIDDSRCKVAGGKKAVITSESYYGGSTPWRKRGQSSKQADDPHITIRRDEVLQYNESCKAVAAPQVGTVQAQNRTIKQGAVHATIHSEEAAKGEGDDPASALPVSPQEFARDIRFLRAWFKKQVVQVSEDLRATMMSSCETQRRDTQKRVQFQSNQQQEFFDHLIQSQHETLNRILNHKIETQILQVQHRLDKRLNSMIEELKDFIQDSLKAGAQKRLKFY